MVKIAGKYQHEHNENFVAYLKELGAEITDEIAEKLDSIRSVLEVTVNGNDITLETATSNASFTVGETFEDEILPGIKVESTATLEDNVLTITSSSSDARSGSRAYAFSDDGLVITYSTGSSDTTAKRIYNRIA